MGILKKKGNVGKLLSSRKKVPKSHTKTDLSIVLKFETILFKNSTSLSLTEKKSSLVFFFLRIIIDTVLTNESL